MSEDVKINKDRTWLPISLVATIAIGVWGAAVQWGGVRTELRDLNGGLHRMEVRLDRSVEARDFDRWAIQLAEWNPDTVRVPYPADMREGKPIREVITLKGRNE